MHSNCRACSCGVVRATRCRSQDSVGLSSGKCVARDGEDPSERTVVAEVTGTWDSNPQEFFYRLSWLRSELIRDLAYA